MSEEDVIQPDVDDEDIGFGEARSLGRWLSRPQTLIGLSALLLSVCGLFISIYEASLVRRQQRASAWPHLEVAPSLGDGRVKLWIRNTGVGPARIHAAALTYDGETLPGWDALLRELSEDAGRIPTYRSQVSGRVFPADSQGEAFFAVEPESGEAARELVPILRREIETGRLDVEVCYCSVFEDCWIARLQDIVARSRVAEPGVGSRQVESCAGADVSGI